MRNIHILLFFFLYNIAFGQWTTDNMSVEKRRVKMEQANDKLLFVGEPSDIVDIYNLTTDEWTSTTLPDANTHNFLAAYGDEIFVAGYRNSSPFYGGRMRSYNVETGEWKRIDYPNVWDATGLVAVDHLIFAVDEDYLDIYDAVENTWTSLPLSESRILPHLVSCNGKVFAAGGGFTFGGLFSLVDVYDTADESFTTINMSEARNSIQSTCLNNKVYFVGGNTPDGDSQIIDVYDTEDDSWEVLNISIAKAAFAVASHGQSIYIGGGVDEANNILDDVEIINTTDGSVSFDSLSEARFNIGAFSHDNKIYFAGGNWAVFDLSNRIDILELSATSIKAPLEIKKRLQVFPNPARSEIYVANFLEDQAPYHIYDFMGKKIQSGILQNGKIQIGQLYPGMYIIKVGKEQSAAFVKQ